LQPVVAQDRQSVQLSHRWGELNPTKQLESVVIPEGDALLIDATGVLTPEMLGWHGDDGVPVLERIPYVSRLFKSVSYRRIETVFLMITPRVIIAEEEEGQ
jgi:general secretion pathway protein D